MGRLHPLNILLPSTVTLVGRVRSQADRSPTRTIVRFLGESEADETCLDYARIDRLARGVGAQLQEAGAAGERALIVHPPGVDYLIALLACLYAGVVAVPAYPPSRRALGRLASIAADAGARFALAGTGAADALPALAPAGAGESASLGGLARLRWLATDHRHELGDGEWESPVSDPGAVALLQYTSGSTSAPKGVRLTHANFLDNIDALTRVRGENADDRIVSWLPPFHDMGLVFGMLGPLCTGLEATLMAPATFLQRPLRWLSAISRYGGTISGGPNFAFELCVRRITAPEQLAALDLSRWRMAFCGAERVRADTMERFAAAFAPARLRPAAMTPCYGLAESTVGVAFSATDRPPRVLALDGRALGELRAAAPRPGQAAQLLVACGTPLAGCELRIVDPDTRLPLADDRVGEIWVRSPSVGDGYWEKPEINREVFHARLAAPADAAGASYLRTGDLGFLRDAELFVVGRIKDLIILRGINYYPEDIEATAQASFPLLRAGGTAAFSVDEEGEERLVIVQEVASARDAPLAQIAAAISGAVAQAHEIAVERVVLVPPGAVPKTSSGKVQRNQCRDQLREGRIPVLGLVARAAVPAPGAADVPAALVEQVAALMADLLGLPAVAAGEDFFWLGGHSLMATRLVSRIRDAFAIELPLRAVFEAPTPALLAARIGAAPVLERLPPIEPVDRGQPLRLSFSQERMWLMHQLDPRGAAYNVGGGLDIDGPLDAGVLQRTLDAVIARHEVLRTNYPSVEGQATVSIRPVLHLPLPVIDVSGAPDPAGAAQALGAALLHAPFDIAAEPLLRAALYRIGPERHLLCVSLHHLVTDAWSIGILVGDMFHCYDALAAGRTPDPPSGQLTYVDYAHWQRDHLGGARLADQLAHWKQRLAGAEPVALPVDRPRSQRRSSAGAFAPLPLSDALVDALTALGARQGATLFMVMLAAFDVLLHRHTGAADLVVGVPVANRNRLASESLMGSLVNTLALRVGVDPDGDFTQLLAQVRETALDAFANQDLPFERLVAELPVERRPGESPVVSVMFDFQNAPVPGRAHGPLRMRPVMLPRGASQFDLSLFIFQAGLGRLASIEYSTELFDAATIGRLLEHYVAILEAVVADPTVPLSRIPIIGPEERAGLLAIGTRAAAGAAAPQTVPAAFAACVQRSPDAVALVDAGGSVRYDELDAAAARLCACLQALGAGPGERVAVFLERDRQLAVALLAVLRTGAAYVPLDPRHPAERVGYTLGDCAPRVVLSHSRLRDALAQAQAATGAAAPACLCIDELPAAPSPLPAAPEAGADPRRAAYVIYTSGSTGRPKGVEVSTGALANFLQSMRHTPGIQPSDRLLAVTTVAFDIAGLELWLPLTSGACVRLVSGDAAADGAALLDLMRRWRPTIMQATPATWKMLLEVGWEGDAALKVLCGGEAFAPELAQALLERSHSVWNLYGPTETTIWSTVHRVRDGEGPLVPIGTPIADTRVYVLDRHGALQPRGVAGEIFIGGAGVANGYFRRPELSAERFVADPFSPDPGARMYRTGDGGRIRADHRFECLARLDDQIKLRGYRIEPGEIEVAIKDHPAVRDAIVVGRAHGDGDQRLVAYYVAASGPMAGGHAPATPDTLRELLQRRLPSYMVPSAFVALDAFPTTPNGKIDRQRLPAPPAEAPAGAQALVGPRDALEAELVDLWQEVLDIRPIGVRQGFFELGGHSLLAVRVFARIEKQLGVTLPLSTLLERPTIEYLAERIRRARGADAAAAATAAPPDPRPAGPAPESAPPAYLVPVQPRGTRPPLFCVHGAGGNVLNFADLARRLGADQPFFGFQARGVDGRAEPFERIEDMAQAYVGELRMHQPRGPYFLTGYCGGGVIAFEMARRLRDQGEQVAFLGLLDCYRPGVGTGVKRHERWATGVVTEGVPYLVRKTVIWLRRNFYQISCALRIAAYRVRGRTVPFELRDFWLTQAFLESTRRYHPGVYEGRLTILRATQVDQELLGVGPELGWRGYATQGIEAFDVPGDHYSLLREPNIGVLAATLKQCLQGAEGPAPT